MKSVSVFILGLITIKHRITTEAQAAIATVKFLSILQLNLNTTVTTPCGPDVHYVDMKLSSK